MLVVLQLPLPSLLHLLALTIFIATTAIVSAATITADDVCTH